MKFTVDGREITISSADRVVFPELGVTKADVASYFVSVGPGLMRGLRGRPVTLERWPKGLPGESFYAKRIPRGLPAWVGTAEVTYPSGRRAIQVCPGDLASVLWLVNLGTLRFHPWPVRGAAPDLVDELRLDLDPQPGTEFPDAVAAALELRRVLADVGLEGWCKTSGGRGVHVYARIEPADFIDARHAAIALGRELARRMPEQVTTHWWKEERGRRVFVDFNQMARDRLMTSAYSIRPTAEARVSAPVTWDDLPQVDPRDFTVVSMPRRFEAAGDPWEGMDAAAAGSLAPALAWYERGVAAGEGELPYPPEYPKMPGEPPRVQPSRARKGE